MQHSRPITKAQRRAALETPAKKSSSGLSFGSDKQKAGYFRQLKGLTLVEVMVSLTILATVMLAYIGTFLQSRRSTEAAVLHAAATSMVYGVIEQIKQIDYDNLPNNEIDPKEQAQDPSNLINPPYIRVRINQNRLVWLQVVPTLVTDEDAATTTIPYPQGPTVTPAPDATITGAIDNNLGSIPLSTITGTASQEINLHIMLWVDGISNKGIWASEGTAPAPDTAEVKKMTIIYTYTYLDGGKARTIRDREVFLRTRYDQ